MFYSPLLSLPPPAVSIVPALVVDANRKLTYAVSSSVTKPWSAQIGKSITNHTPKSLRNTHTNTHTPQICSGSIAHNTHTPSWSYAHTHTHAGTQSPMHEQNGSTLHTQHLSLANTLVKHNGFTSHTCTLQYTPQRLHFRMH